GWQALWTAAMDPRVTRTTVSGIFLGHACLNNPDLHHKCQTVPALWHNRDRSAPLLEASDLAALHAIGAGGSGSRPLFVQWGADDGFYQDQASCWGAARTGTEAVYNRFANSAGFRFEVFTNLGHEMENLTEVDFMRGQRTTVVRDHSTQCNSMHCCPSG